MNPPIGRHPISRRAVIVAPALALAACGTNNYEGPTIPGEIEATSFEGTELTPINKQRGNALAGTQQISRDSYQLTVDGLVDNPMRLSYADLEAREQDDLLLQMNCVEGWSYIAKWTGPSLTALLADAGVRPEAAVVIFHTADQEDGYTSLDLRFLTNQDVMLAMKLNDVTLPAHKGFPIQLVATAKFGYKWAKWITRIQVSDDTDFRGYWEARGYHQVADDDGPAFG